MFLPNWVLRAWCFLAGGHDWKNEFVKDQVASLRCRRCKTSDLGEAV